MPDAFKIKTPAFEGPLDLLLNLVEKRKLFINDISLAQVTDDFIAYIQSFPAMPIADSAQFILIASTLLLIKSKSLLPTLTLTEEEEAGIHDLEIRLKIYQRIKDASLGIKDIFGKQIIFSQSQNRPIEPTFSPHKTMTLASLSQAIKDIIKAFPKKEFIPKAVVRKVISLEETIDDLTKRINQNLKIRFSEFVGGHKEERVNVIVCFLAMLELVKQGIIHVTQENHFEDIHIETKEVGVPRYN
jgi:segregation and condensation protein A